MKFFLGITILLFSCTSNKSIDFSEEDNKYFTSISHNDIKLEEPKAGEWRSLHKEDAQTLIKYINLNPKKAEIGVTEIYLLPIGSFSKEQKKIIDLTREYLQIFFQLTTKTLGTITDLDIPDSSRRKRQDGIDQLCSQHIIKNLLQGNTPTNGYALMAITEKDLYPSPDWNFVFGEASYGNRVGVSSLYRLGNKPLDSISFNICLKRILNIASHEIGHMFSLKHCILAKCTMNGSNNLSETDICPNRLCTECQKKLFWNIGYDNKKRLKEITIFFKANNLIEDFTLAQKDLERVK